MAERPAHTRAGAYVEFKGAVYRIVRDVITAHGSPGLELEAHDGELKVCRYASIAGKATLVKPAPERLDGERMEFAPPSTDCLIAEARAVRLSYSTKEASPA